MVRETRVLPPVRKWALGIGVHPKHPTGSSNEQAICWISKCSISSASNQWHTIHSTPMCICIMCLLYGIALCRLYNATNLSFAVLMGGSSMGYVRTLSISHSLYLSSFFLFSISLSFDEGGSAPTVIIPVKQKKNIILHTLDFRARRWLQLCI